MIEALATIRERIPEAKLHIYPYGKYEPAYRRQLETQIAELGLGDGVDLNVYQPLEEIVKIINASDVGIVPYLSDEFMSLALSTKGFEYIAMGLPVVASRLDPMTHIFDDDSVTYFEPGNPRDLADSVLRLCEQPDLRQSRTEKASVVYEEIAWPIMRERYVGLIKEYIERRAKA